MSKMSEKSALPIESARAKVSLDWENVISK
jgi:hypothetical protein